MLLGQVLSDFLMNVQQKIVQSVAGTVARALPLQQHFRVIRNEAVFKAFVNDPFVIVELGH